MSTRPKSPQTIARNKAANKALLNKIGSAVETTKKTIVDKTSDVLSAPARAYYGMKSAQSDSDTKTLKTARSYDNAPSFTSTGAPSDALKARTMADEVKGRLKSK